MTTDPLLMHNDKSVEDLTEGEISLMEPGERKNLIDNATLFVVNGGYITPDQCASLVRLLVYTRRRAVKDNPRATAMARATVTAASLDDI